ncbi:ATP synthase subunit I [Sphingobium sp.]|uniref:N-ATPase subunit AtpR n=1 Tax=Sphingobium sp. TaxID=1912891 RepID=UPI000DB040A3|nr:ATP synthase subunit I [Sphingobium sp.]PZU64818.1 MAG: ATP synthase subunit I [Sphingobium sp.]
MIILVALLFLALGAVAGTIHFAMIAKDADLLVHGESVLMAIGLRLARLLLTATVLIGAALNGWPSLLAATSGLVAARQFVIRRLQVTT